MSTLNLQYDDGAMRITLQRKQSTADNAHLDDAHLLTAVDVGTAIDAAILGGR
jgi:hypothetical protein